MVSGAVFTNRYIANGGRDAELRSDLLARGEALDFVPSHMGKRYENWDVEDPAGKPPATVRAIRDDIRRRVVALLDTLGVSPAGR
jgi:protein-tyrosine-phosphatase